MWRRMISEVFQIKGGGVMENTKKNNIIVKMMDNYKRQWQWKWKWQRS